MDAMERETLNSCDQRLNHLERMFGLSWVEAQPAPETHMDMDDVERFGHILEGAGLRVPGGYMQPNRWTRHMGQMGDLAALVDRLMSKLEEVQAHWLALMDRLDLVESRVGSALSDLADRVSATERSSEEVRALQGAMRAQEDHWHDEHGGPPLFERSSAPAGALDTEEGNVATPSTAVSPEPRSPEAAAKLDILPDASADGRGKGVRRRPAYRREEQADPRPLAVTPRHRSGPPEARIVMEDEDHIARALAHISEDVARGGDFSLEFQSGYLRGTDDAAALLNSLVGRPVTEGGKVRLMIEWAEIARVVELLRGEWS